MAETLLELLEEWGIWGVLASLFIEGSAFPFIGTFFIVTVGFVMELSWLQIAWISAVGSLLYAIGSYIPYFIGYALGSGLAKRLSEARRQQLEQASAAFSKYGIWSVAIASPLHLGNAVPFIAGMSRMKLHLYTLLTMLGIAPSTFLLLSIGKFYPGDRDAAMDAIVEYQSYVLAAFMILTAAYIGWKIYRSRLARRNVTDKTIGS
ncbi:Putative membrane-associated protein [Thermobacillus xylanilyticus]|uniref:Membrane-associated protein n=1 Tax=Thermobacillus xylanilyticus TaxID=76633 RepID=A0ABM8V6F0_THEXY|nr:VTT domain-containing protein [Thermobacillus xylanilyticus]CAG5090514.1 Putative membrane-associated protein [Thermobacillus xylanilyticus]